MTRFRRRASATLAGLSCAALMTTVVPGVVGAAVPDPISPPAAGSSLIDCSRAAERVQVSVSSHLDPSCIYTAGIDVIASDVVLDCQGALIARAGGGRGIEVQTPADVSMSGVAVRNCRVDGFLNSIRVTRIGFRGLEPGDEYTHHLSAVLIENSHVSDSFGVGIYVDGYVDGVTIRNVTVTGAGGSDIYLEAGSHHNVVAGNIIHDNGYNENGPDGALFESGGLTFRWWGIGREGVSVDGSYDNHIVGNSFAGNSAGGIFIYTNCGEYVTQRPERWFERRFGAERNLIEANSFTGGVNGIWVGSRMGENVFPMECSDPAYVEAPGLAVTRDRAANNTIRTNTFADVTYGVRVEDDGTRVLDNTFTATDATHHAVVVGTPQRTTVAGDPVRDTTIADNVAEISGNRFPYRWVHGADALAVTGNTASGRPTGLCRGEALPRGPFVFVITLVPQDPDEPPVPPPDLTVPTVGELAPCATIMPGVTAKAEGDGKRTTVRIPVKLTDRAIEPVTVRWETLAPAEQSGIATPGEDYVAAAGTVTFAPGQRSRTVRIVVRPDQVSEPDEAVFVRFFDPTEAGVGGFYGLGVAVITNDDG